MRYRYDQIEAVPILFLSQNLTMDADWELIPLEIYVFTVDWPWTVPGKKQLSIPPASVLDPFRCFFVKADQKYSVRNKIGVKKTILSITQCLYTKLRAKIPRGPKRKQE